MPRYTFRFHFPMLDADRQVEEVKTYGGHIGTALNRAWKEVKCKVKYANIKGLRPTGIDIGPPEPRRK